MRIIKVIEAKRWKNLKTGATASPYGSVPWSRASEEPEWWLEPTGFTWAMDNGTIGLGRAPAKTREEAEYIMQTHNARLDEMRREHEKRFPPRGSK